VPAPIPIDVRTSPESVYRAQLDRFGYLDTRYREAKPWLTEREALKKLIQVRHDLDAAELPIRDEGSLYFVDLTPREQQRVVTSKTKAFAALKKALGIKAFTEALTYTFKLLDEFVPSEKQAAFVTQARTGPRDVTGVIKTAPQAA
jgi:hypothetical protein